MNRAMLFELLLVFRQSIISRLSLSILKFERLRKALNMSASDYFLNVSIGCFLPVWAFHFFLVKLKYNLNDKVNSINHKKICFVSYSDEILNLCGFLLAGQNGRTSLI